MPTESDAPGNEPNLELPSFGFGRKKKRDRSAAEAEPPHATASAAGASAAEPDAEDTAALPTAGAHEPTPVTPPAPAAAPVPARVPEAGQTPARPAARPPARPPSRPATPPAAVTAPTPPAPGPAKPPSVRPATPPPPAPEPTVGSPSPAARPPASSPATGTEQQPWSIESDTEPAVIDPLARAAAALDRPRSSRPNRRRKRAEARARKRSQKTVRERPAPTEALAARMPRIKPLYAALLTGTLSGLAAVLLAIGASRGCEAVRDTSSCGGGLGLLATVAILVIEVLIGAGLLMAWRISDPVSTSFLGVGLVAIIAMLFFLSEINSVWMLLVIPLMTAASFALSWWVTVKFIDEYDTDHPRASDRGGADAHAASANKAENEDSSV